MIRWLPVLGLLLFVAVGFGWRAWFHRRHFGGSGIALFRSGRWDQHLREAALVLLEGLLLAQAVAAALGSALVAGWILFPAGPVAAAAGGALMLGSILLMVAAQLDMGASWRVGFDLDARPGLVVGGLYRFSRNPIYVAVLVALAGYFLLVPTWLSLVLLVASAIGLRNQARMEESFLLAAYGDQYVAYAARVGRFLPGIGRLHSGGAPSAA